MSTPLTRTELLAALRAGRDQWEALLASIGEDRMTQSGAAGQWSVRDVIAHITAYEAWLVDWLGAALRGEFPAPSVLDAPGVDARNAVAHEAGRHLSLAEVQARAAQNFDALVALLQQFPEDDFVHPERTEWFMKPYWRHQCTIAEAVLNLTLEHYEEHIPSLRAWAERGA